MSRQAMAKSQEGSVSRLESPFAGECCGVTELTCELYSDMVETGMLAPVESMDFGSFMISKVLHTIYGESFVISGVDGRIVMTHRQPKIEAVD